MKPGKNGWTNDWPSLDEFYYAYQPPNFQTAYLYNRNCTLDFVPSDTELTWKNIINDTKDYKFVKSHVVNYESIQYHSVDEFIEYYKLNPISYVHNSLGFRDSDWDNKPNTVDLYLGCSFTFGIGLHLDDVWTTKLQKELNHPFINGGIPGSGIIPQYRLLMYLLTRFTIRNVFHLFLYTHPRFEYYDVGHYKSFNLYDAPNGHPLFTPENVSTFNHGFLKGIEHVCYENNIKYYRLNNIPKWKADMNTQPLDRIYARDLRHVGPAFHDIIKDKFFSKIVGS